MSILHISDGQLTNVVFCIVAIIVGLVIIDVDVERIFVVLAAVLVAVAFMIGAAASKYLEVRLLFVLLWTTY